jgi:hypothetical protein
MMGKTRAAVVVMGVLGAALLLSHREWIYYGRPCWDQYCHYADLIRDWLVSLPESRETLRRFMEQDYHANSPLVPFVTALLLITIDVETVMAYRIACVLATTGGMLIIFRSLLGAHQDRDRVQWPLFFLVATNPVLVRSTFFPQTDAFVFLLSTAVLSVALRYEGTAQWRLGASLAALLVAGLLTKLSFLPHLALGPLWTCRRRGTCLKAVLMFAVVPFSLFLAWQWAAGTGQLYKKELALMASEDTFFPFKVMSLLHGAFFFLILIGIGWKTLARTHWLLLSWAGLYLLSLWVTGASGWDRFYLTLVPPLAVASLPGLRIMCQSRGEAAVWIFALLAGSVNYGLLWFHLYY